jgi:hypothetical protein
VAKDRRLQLPQGWRRVQAQLVAEQGPQLAVGVKGLDLAAGPVERQHELAAGPPAQRLGGHQVLQLPDQLAAGPSARSASIRSSSETRRSSSSRAISACAKGS